MQFRLLHASTLFTCFSTVRHNSSQNKKNEKKFLICYATPFRMMTLAQL